ncbi:symmetrical bis(5'-nucleosyl)-tetraphosphatase [Chromatium okenii]|jgi:bis(5'-nucleosyl)-tetraphosphatase (symmetrical)|uniref:Bis(5'-nucleosyl)-tetraphosphatase, symmetrical n=1 Tax=Chromatium okenii TaxID=61644 RepID=A0A2S7XS05_9GAMM|nr:symmetrical bis(5'-nucleosyl)-tetraphosphatase [Chromatium okenii]MBV5311200.1 symmetrical bis(5'-nucleosyl)-tetraphosphatase [Chromatium okenii]PQJ96534.1 diadenosine tetraphosphatase [Chromatium okenii]
MPIYAIGDIQGCLTELQILLHQLQFNPQQDRLWLVGDLVNRGPDSLAVLRFIRTLGDAAVVVLGNHDLHLLALAAGNLKHANKSNLDAVLQAPDRDELLHWLRQRPLLHHDAARELTLIHAGLPPQWTLADARAAASELENVLRSDDYQTFLLAVYGNQPAQWSPNLTGIDRLRFITNCLTRLRFCTPDGRLALKEKGEIGSQTPGLIPWFQVANRRTRHDRIIFGHWSTLGYYAGDNVWAIDSGCLWGGTLTALRVEPLPLTPIHLKCNGYLTPGQD